MKKNSTFIILCTVSVLIIFGCEGPAGPAGVQGVPGTNGRDGGFDKQIRLDFNINGNISSQDTTGVVTPEPFRIVKFNKSNYLNVDSIVFIAFLQSSDTSAACKLMLVNITDNVDIDTSLIQAKDTVYTLVESKNIFNSLPAAKEITLGLKIMSSKQNVSVAALQPAVYLYRR